MGIRLARRVAPLVVALAFIGAACVPEAPPTPTAATIDMGLLEPNTTVPSPALAPNQSVEWTMKIWYGTWLNFTAKDTTPATATPFTLRVLLPDGSELGSAAGLGSTDAKYTKQGLPLCGYYTFRIENGPTAQPAGAFTANYGGLIQPLSPCNGHGGF